MEESAWCNAVNLGNGEATSPPANSDRVINDPLPQPHTREDGIFKEDGDPGKVSEGGEYNN